MAEPRRLTFLQAMAVAIAGAGGDSPEIAWQRIRARGETELWLGKAREVLAAVPVPTEAMIEAHFRAHAEAATVFADVRDVWRAMVQAAAARDQVPAVRRAGDISAPPIEGVLR